MIGGDTIATLLECNMAAKVNLLGQVFDRLIVLADSGGRASNGGILWVCKCSCGETIHARGDHLQSGHTESCGCKHRDIVREKFTIHGLAMETSGGNITATFSSWNSMMQRVKDKRPHMAKYYLNKGITVCERWHQYPNFLEDMGECPVGKTLDRIKGDEGYSKGNCRWATDWEQGQNRSNESVNFSEFPEIESLYSAGKSIKEIASCYDVPYRTMLNVIRRRIPASKESSVATLTAHKRNQLH